MTKKPHQKIAIYTDGACSGNPGPGGWGVYMIYGGHEKKLYGEDPNTTNNRMELTAAIEALKALKKRCTIDLYTDSVYVKDGITGWIDNWIKNNWRTSNKALVKNVDLWQNLHSLTADHDITWHWVKGHGASIGNNIADELAVLGRNKALEKLKCQS